MKILLVEDDPDLGKAIKQMLNQQKYVVDWVLDGTEAWDYLETQWMQYTLFIFDWLLPGLSGLELCKRLRGRHSPLPILMLTAKDQMEDKVAGLEAGADDYLVKPFGMAELLARVRALQRRSPQLQPQHLQVGSLTLDYGTCTVCFQTTSGQQQVIPLTAKEFQLLEYLMKHPNQIVTREQIRNQLWEVNTEPVSNVVAAQVRLLRRKLAEYGGDSEAAPLAKRAGNARQEHRLIETVPSMGYRLNPTYESK